MNYVEYGKENKDIIILLHGGGLSWWNYREVAEKLSDEYRVILPVLDGHASSTSDFTTIEANAARIIKFIREQLGGSVLMMGGLSLGGQVLLEILSQQNDICQYALIESALVVPSKMTYAMIKPTFGSCYGLIHKRWFAKLQFKYLRIKETLFDEYYGDTCSISKTNMISFLQANSMYRLKESLEKCSTKTYIFVGSKENISVRKSAELIHEKMRESVLQVLPGMYHGEFSINHSEDYTEKIRSIIGGK